MVQVPRIKPNGKEWFDSKEVGIIAAVESDPSTAGKALYAVTLKDDTQPEALWERLEDVERPRFEVLEETTYFQICDRVVGGVAALDPDPAFLIPLKDFMYEEAIVAAGRILAGLGLTNSNVTFFNCFVKRIQQDSCWGIADHWSTIFQIFRRGGGCGWSLSILRPKGSPVRGVNGRSSGVCSWATHFAAITGTVEQGGSRRGASLQALDIWHPDILEFIKFKSQLEHLTCPHCDHAFSRDPKIWESSNVSVLVSDAFMEALAADTSWDLVFPDTSDPDYDTLWDGNLAKWRNLGKKVDVYQTVKAKELWNAIVEGAHFCGEPGVLFMDRMNYMSNSYYYAPLVCTNPCGEQCLPEDGICNLGHLNLAKFLCVGTPQFPHQESTAAEAIDSFDVPKFSDAVMTLVRFLDNIIDLNKYHDEKLEKSAKQERRIGLGFLGYGELLMRCGLRYGSPEALSFSDWLFNLLKEESYKSSIELAKERGSFPALTKELFLKSGFLKTFTTPTQQTIVEAIRTHGIRNVTLNTSAPTGSVGTMVGTSTGIEPYISLKFTARSRIGATTDTINIFEELEKKFGHNTNQWPSYVVTANDIEAEDHINTQAVAQRHIDASISKTINLPNSATQEDIDQAFLLMYNTGCKGGTVYRDGSRTEQVLYSEPTTTAQPTPAVEVPLPIEITVIEGVFTGLLRPPLKKALATSESIETPIGKVHAFLRFHPSTGEPYDFFCHSGKGDVAADVQALSRLISVILRWPDNTAIPQAIRLEIIVDQLCDIYGRTQVGIGPDAIYSVPDGLGKFLNSYLSAAFPLPGLPMGDEQLEDFIDKLQKCKDRTQMIDFIKKGVLMGTKPPASISKEDPTKNGSTSGRHMEYCPRCNNATFVRIPGHCPFCTNQQCGYSEC